MGAREKSGRVLLPAGGGFGVRAPPVRLIPRWPARVRGRLPQTLPRCAHPAPVTAEQLQWRGWGGPAVALARRAPS